VDKNAMTILLVVGLVVAGTAGGMVYVEAKRAREERTRAEALERQVDAAGKTEMALRLEAVQHAKRIEAAQSQAAEAEQRVAKAKAELAAIKNPPEDKPNCFDSDAKYGVDAIYFRGSVRVGGGTSYDHCRLGQLVEFSCIENPAGSGRFIPDATIADCPSGSRCVDGECLR
jgi:hypothetical protein